MRCTRVAPPRWPPLLSPRQPLPLPLRRPQPLPLETKLRQRRKSLADEIGRAAESIALNISEGRQRAGLDRADLFRRAAGSASELTTALRIARARGYITLAEFAAVDAALDRVRGMLWRLTH